LAEHSGHIESVEHLVEHLREMLTPASVVVCVGSEISGDDGAGPAVAKLIAGQVPWPVFDTQTVPESFLMKIVAARPETVLLVDALDFGAAPGSVELFAAEAVTGQGPSTHGPAPIAFLDLLNMLHPCRRAVLGIQPARAEFGQPISPEVHKAVEMVTQALILAGKPA
jgi:hydrogenase 3 maturation protease